MDSICAMAFASGHAHAHARTHKAGQSKATRQAGLAGGCSTASSPTEVQCTQGPQIRRGEQLNSRTHFLCKQQKCKRIEKKTLK